VRIQKRRKKRDSVSLIGRRNFPRLLVVARLQNSVLSCGFFQTAPHTFFLSKDLDQMLTQK